MKNTILVAFLPLFVSSIVLAQTNQPPADAKPASSNMPGAQFPKIDSERRAYFHIRAPEAKSVSVSLPGGRRMTKGADGVWGVTTDPLAPGFHYYSITVDGVTVPDPMFWDKFTRVLIEDFIPMIDSTYRTLRAANLVAVSRQSHPLLLY